MGAPQREQQTLSGVPWNGFHASFYTLNYDEAAALPVERHFGPAVSDFRGTTLGTVLEEVLETGRKRNEKFVIDRGGLALKVSVGDCTLTLRGPSFSLDLLAAFLQLENAGIRFYNGLWFYSDSDHVTDDPHESFHFFVVADNKVVLEDVAFHDYSSSGFNPRVLSEDSYEGPWRNGPLQREAFLALWYRKFYMETDSGRLLVLRPDEPTLHYYPEARRGADLSDQMTRLERDIRGIKASIWILVVIAALCLWALSRT